MHRIEVEQISDHNLCTHVAQSLGALVLISHHGTHCFALLQQQFGDGTPYPADAARGAGNQYEVCHCFALSNAASPIKDLATQSLILC